MNTNTIEKTVATRSGSIFELEPRYSHQVSFWGRAHVGYTETTYTDGDFKIEYTLYSYNTPILTITEYSDGTKTIERLWRGYSATTGKHVLEFSKQFWDTPIYKKQYDLL